MSREKLAERYMANDASKTTPKGRKKRVGAADKRDATLQSEPATAKASHLRLVEVVARSEADGKLACTELQRSHASLIEVEQKAKLAREDLGIIRE